jgi:hypothetical protein
MRRVVIALFLALGLIGPPLAYAQQLQILWIDPAQGPICAGPVGPGPCALVAQYIQTHGPQAVGVRLNNQLPNVLPLPPAGEMPSPNNIQPLNASISANSVAGAAQCAQMTGQDQQVNVDAFLVCTHGAVALNKDSAMLVNCAEQANGDMNTLAECAGRGLLGSRLTPSQMKAVECVSKNTNDKDGFAGCLGGFAADQLNPQQRQLLNCANNNDINSGGFALCAGRTMFGDQLSPEANAAIDCAVQSKGDYMQFGGCAANTFLNSNLNLEQQIAVECVVSSGGQPYVAAGCAASRLTARELTKCIENGVGGDGCFGDNNDLVGRNGWVVRNVAALGGGPNSVIHDPGQILGGPNSVLNPRQLLGGPNSVPNVVLQNIPSPPPVQLGTVGGHRVCIPWC